ncbi:MAG: T9SS type A sorting domain-containing protein [Ignavibacteriae bacterium]|nr:T9SS type A sorting domain-containing protein [Ignavibacteriota bacterium]
MALTGSVGTISHARRLYCTGKNSTHAALIAIVTWMMFPGAAAGQDVLLRRTSPDPYFEENRGQIMDEHGKTRRDVLFAQRDGGASLYLTRGGFEYVFARVENPDAPVSEATGRAMSDRDSHPVITAYQRVDMRFRDPSPSVRVRGIEEKDYLLHYYTVGAGPDAETVRTFAGVVYENVYRGIDLVLRAEPRGIKYHWVVHPGASVGDIRVFWSGADRLQQEPDGGLRVISTLGELSEAPPVAWQDTPTGRRPVQVSSRVVGMDIHLDCGDYDAERKLTVDPRVIWATYYGGDLIDRACAVDTDADDNVVVVGETTSLAAISTPGTFQAVHAGAWDGFMAKFDSAGNRLWSTYVGGAASDNLVSVSCDGSGIMAAGSTTSAGMATSGVHQTTLGGIADILLLRFSAAGVRLWATYYGGPGAESPRAVSPGGGGRVLVSARTNSGSGIEIGGSWGGYSGGTDGAVAVFNASGALLWGRYIGGPDEDQCHGITTDGARIFVAGSTRSTTGLATPGAFLTTQQGDWDMFLACVAYNGTIDWATYYGGSGLESDIASGIRYTGGNRIIIGGKTTSTSGMTTTGVFQETHQGGSADGFLAAFDSAGHRHWGTYIGSAGWESITGLDVDAEGAIMIFGQATATSSLANFNNVHQSTLATDGLFVGRVEGEGTDLRWCTFYGGSQTWPEMWGASNGCVDLRGNVYVCGTTNSQTLIAYGNPHQGAFGGGSSDGCLAKFLGGKNRIVTRDGAPTYCEGDTLIVHYDLAGVYGDHNMFHAQLSDSTGNFGAPVIIGSVKSWMQDSIIAVIPVGTPGGSAYRIRVVSTNPRLAGTETRAFRIVPLPVAIVAPAGTVSICEGQSLILRADSAMNCTYVWEEQTRGMEGVGPSLLVTRTGKYRVVVTNTGGCRAWSPWTEVVASPRPLATITPWDVQGVCEGDSVVLSGPDSTGYTFEWSTGETTRVLRVSKPGLYRLVVRNAAGCSDTSAPVRVVVYPLPVLSVAGRGRACQYTVWSYRVTKPAGTSLVWTATGGAVLQAQGDSAVVQWTLPGMRMVQVTCRVDSSGCTSTATLPVQVDAFVPPAIEADPKHICRGSELRLKVQRGYARVAWNTGATTDEIVVRTPGMYRVRVETSDGCAGEDSVRITVVDPPNAQAPTDTTICGESEVLLTGDARDGTPPYGYRWIGENVTDEYARTTTARPSTAGIYVLEVTDANGCTGRDTLRVQKRAAPPVGIRALGALRFCLGDSVTLEADAGFVRYEWSDGQRGRRVVIRRAGMYHVLATDTSGCTARSDPLTVEVKAIAVNITALGPLRFCAGDSVVLRVEGAPARVRWNTGDSTRYLVVRSTGTYWARGWDTFGCEGASLPLQVTVNPLPRVAIGGPASVCAGTVGRHWLREVRGLRVLWRIENGTLLTGENADTVDVRWSVAGNGRLVLTCTDTTTGCTDSTIAPIIIGTSLTPVIVGPTAICAGDTAVFDAGDGYAFYTWRNEADSIVGTRSQLRVTTAGRYRVFVRDAGTCEGDASHRLIVHPKPGVSIVGAASFCTGDSVLLSASGTFIQYVWRNESDTVVGNTPTYTVRTPGLYTLAVTDGNGCTARSTPHAVSELAHPVAAIAGPTSACSGTVQRYGTPPGTGVAYRWSVLNGTTLSASDADTFTVRWDAPGTGRVVLTVTNAACSASDTLDLTVGSSLTPSIAGRSRICAGDSALLDAGAGYRSYLWRLPNGDSADTRSIRIAATGVYTVTVYDEGGCSGSARHLLRVDVLPAPAIAGPQEICAGDTAVLDAGVFAGVYTWRDAMGTMLGVQRTLAVTQTGVFTVTVTDTNSCTGSSPPHALLVHPRPSKPVVTLRGDTLATVAGYAYRWYRNDTLIAGAASDTHIAASPGWYHVSITDTHGCTNEADPIEYTGAARVATAHIILPFLEAAPGERVEIPVVIAASTHLDAADVRSFRATLRYHAGVLAPMGSTPPGVLSGAERLIPFTADTASRPLSPGPVWPPVATLVFRATLGSVSQTPLTLEDMNFGATDVRVTVQPGGFRLLVCREGGERLFSDSGRLSIGQNSPNPFNAQTTIEYETIENGPVFLAVYDLLGRETAVLVDAPLVPGRRRVLFDAQALPSGQYIAVLRSGSGVRTMRMVVAK